MLQYQYCKFELERMNDNMADVFFTSCKAKASYKGASVKLQRYIKQKMDIDPIGCCRLGHQKLTSEDTAIVVCNNCAAIIEESSNVGNVEFVWDIIDSDNAFSFPDYHGEKMTIQDCWVAFEKRELQNTIRSLMKKMNIEIVELEENFEKTKFCGVNLLSPCTESNAKLAHRRYVEEGAYMFTPMTQDEQTEYFEKHCRQIETDKVVCYCKFCTDAINQGGKNGIHILNLLFPED